MNLEILLNEAELCLSLGQVPEAYLAFNALAHAIQTQPSKEFVKKYGPAILKLEKALRDAYKQSKKNPRIRQSLRNI